MAKTYYVGGILNELQKQVDALMDSYEYRDGQVSGVIIDRIETVLGILRKTAAAATGEA